MTFDQFSDVDLRRMIKLLAVKDSRIQFVTNAHRNTRGERMEWTRFSHMKELYNSTSPKIAIMGGAQIGKTDFIVVDTLAMAYNGLNAFFVLPKYDMRDSYVQEKFQKPLSISPEYKNIVREGVMSRIQLMQFGHGVIKFVGGNVPSDFVSFSADVLYHEECDKCDSEENLELSFSRLDGSDYKFQRFVSNPTTKSGQIWKRYAVSDKRVWMVPCDSCGECSELDWFRSVVIADEDDSGNVVNYNLRDKKWRAGCGRDIYVICPKCDSGTLQRLSPEAHWKATAESEQRIEGYHMPSIISPNNSVSELYLEFKAGLENPAKMGRFYSMRLALPYAAVGSRVSDSLLNNCVEEETYFEINPDFACVPGHSHPGPCSMGIDCSPTHLDIRISTTGPNGKRRCVYLGKIDGKSWFTLHDLIERYNVQVAVIDIGPEILNAKEFQESAKCTVWRCKYLGVGADRSGKLNHVDMIVSIDRTEALDKGYSNLRTRKNMLPRNYDQIFGGNYAKEMCDLSREVREDAKGNIKYEWVGSTHDHHRHCDAYDLIAFEMMNEFVIDTKTSLYIG